MRCVSVAGLALACAAPAWAYPASARGADAPTAGTSEHALRLADVPRWNDVLARAAADTGRGADTASCAMPTDDSHDDCNHSDWRDAIAGLRGRAAAEQISGVQRRINRLRYVPDQQNWGMADHWETPAEMFARGGDCEGFALTKYFALRELGFDEVALRLAIVWDAEDREQHAVLLVESEGAAWVLDNKFAEPVAAPALAARYQPIWSVNRQGASLSAGSLSANAGRFRLAKGGTMLVIRARPRRRDN